MDTWRRFRNIAEYPGTLAFSIIWAWETRRGSKKKFTERFLDALEDAMDIF